MHLTDREQERLLLAAGADLARRRLARGSRLGAAEAIALVCDEILEWAWDGVPYEEVLARAAGVLPRDALLPGVAALVPFVQVEALFPYGSVLVHVADPFGPRSEGMPGAVRPGSARVDLAPGRARNTARLENVGHAPIWISSHTPLTGLNAALLIELPPGPDAAGWRLDLPAGMSRRFDPGQVAQVGVVALAGRPIDTAPDRDDGEQR